MKEEERYTTLFIIFIFLAFCTFQLIILSKPQYNTCPYCQYLIEQQVESDED
jgi:hypothetical protein